MTYEEAKKEAIERLKAYHAVFCKNDNPNYGNEIIKTLEQPAEPRLVSYAPDGSTCTLNIDGEEVYFNREQLEGKEFFERGKEIARWADKQVQEPVAWMGFDEIGNADFLGFNDFNKYTTKQTTVLKKPIPLYTHPHQWQGLTDDEIKSFEEVWGISKMAIQDLEASFKEKNNVGSS